jgi:hypothetical protein
MYLPSPLFSQHLEKRHIYLFRAEPPGETIPNHLHVCINRSDGEKLYFVCCTTKWNTIINFLNKTGFDYSTAVGIAKDSQNNFDEDTYINCNNVFKCNENEFNRAYTSGKISYIGELGESDYLQVVQGICNSPLVEEEIKDLLKSE